MIETLQEALAFWEDVKRVEAIVASALEVYRKIRAESATYLRDLSTPKIASCIRCHGILYGDEPCDHCEMSMRAMAYHEDAARTASRVDAERKRRSIVEVAKRTFRAIHAKSQRHIMDLCRERESIVLDALSVYRSIHAASKRHITRKNRISVRRMIAECMGII